MQLELSNYTFTIQFKKGSLNAVADCLSRAEYNKDYTMEDLMKMANLPKELCSMVTRNMLKSPNSNHKLIKPDDGINKQNNKSKRPPTEKQTNKNNKKDDNPSENGLDSQKNITDSNQTPSSENNDELNVENENIQPPNAQPERLIFSLDERPGFCTQRNLYGQIFYFIREKSDKIHFRLQKITNTKIDLPHDKLIGIHKNKMVIMVTKTVHSIEDIQTTENALVLILDYCRTNRIEDIAICVDYHTAKSYLTFKKCVRNIFRNAPILLTLYLDKAIQVTSDDQIVEIMKIAVHSVDMSEIPDFEIQSKDFSIGRLWIMT